MIIQMLPDAEEGAVDALEKMIAEMEPITSLISRVQEQSAGKSEAGIVQALMDEIFCSMPDEYRPETLAFRDIQWDCDCSRERLEQVLMTIGKKDLKQIIEEDGEAEMQCHFCLKKYHFNRDELTAILENM